MVDVSTAYATTPDGVYLGYQVSGAGDVDLVWQPDWPGNLDMEWEFPVLRTLLEGLSSFSRLIRHDHRGVGLSSRNVAVPNLETRVADLLVVLDAVGARKPFLVGAGASGAVQALLAATKPERVAGLVWLDCSPRYRWAPDHPWGRTDEDLAVELDDLRSWGTEAYGRAFAEWEAAIGNPIPEADSNVFPRATRNACTPDVAIELSRMWAETDVRDVLPAIRVPTTFVSTVGLREVDRARDAASRTPGAEVIEIEAEGFSVELTRACVDVVRRFVGADRAPTDLDTFLSTVLFTDIVGSTQRQAALGDRRWAQVVSGHHAIVRDRLARWRGIEHDTAGDGFFATFEGPARAIRCAHDIAEAVRSLGIEIRAGVHTGECRTVDGKVGGLAVSIGARVAATAAASEVRATQTVKDLVAGSGLAFVDAGETELKGVPGRWHLYAVPDEGAS